MPCFALHVNVNGRSVSKHRKGIIVKADPACVIGITLVCFPQLFSIFFSPCVCHVRVTFFVVVLVVLVLFWRLCLSLSLSPPPALPPSLSLNPSLALSCFRCISFLILRL